MGLAPTLKQLPNPVDSSDAMGNRLSLQNLSISSTSIPSTSSGSGPPQAGVTDDDQGGACEPTQSPSSNTITNTASPATVEATQSSNESDPPPPRKRLKTSRVAPNSRGRTKHYRMLYMCNLEGCEQTFTLEKDLLRHQKTAKVHQSLLSKEDDDDDELGTGDRIFCDVKTCRFYGRTYSRWDNYKRHVRTCHGKDGQNAEDGEAKQKKKRPRVTVKTRQRNQKLPRKFPGETIKTKTHQ